MNKYKSTCKVHVHVKVICLSLIEPIKVEDKKIIILINWQTEHATTTAAKLLKVVFHGGKFTNYLCDIGCGRTWGLKRVISNKLIKVNLFEKTASAAGFSTVLMEF